MRKKLAVIMACAAAGSISAFTSASRGAQTFTDNFNSPTGDITDGGIFSSGSINGGAVTVTETAVTGPLTIGVTGAPEGGYLQSGQSSSSNFDFTKSPMLLTVSAPAGGSLTPANGGGGVFSNNAETIIGVDLGGNGPAETNTIGTYSPASRLDQSSSSTYGKFILELNPGNALQETFNFWDPTVAHGGAVTSFNDNMGYQHDAIPTGTNIEVTSMFLYLDATDAPDGNLWYNVGATWLDTNTGISTTDWYQGPAGTYPLTSDLNAGANADPATGFPAYNVGNKGGNNGGNLTLQQDEAISQEFAGDTSAAIEVQDAQAAATSNSVQFGSLTVAVPEPTSLSLVGLGAAALLRRKKRHA
jgi:hypothetical protein